MFFTNIFVIGYLLLGINSHLLDSCKIFLMKTDVLPTESKIEFITWAGTDNLDIALVYIFTQLSYF